MRSKWILFPVVCACLPFLQCSSDDASTTSTSNGPDAGVLPDATVASNDSGPRTADSSVADSGTADSGIDGGDTGTGPIDAGPRVDVIGTLLGHAGDDGPLASRTIVVVGADGAVITTNSDGSGQFHASGVAIPYDIGVPYVPLDPASPANPYYYAGITRPDPIVHGVDYQTVPPGPQRVATVTWQSNVTICTNCGIVAASPQSRTSALAGTGIPNQTFSGLFVWTGDTTQTVHLHFLVRAADGTFSHYYDTPAVTLTAGGTTPLGILLLAPTPGNESITFGVTPPPSYSLAGSSIYVLHPDGSTLFEADSTAATNSAHYPSLPNLSVKVGAAAIGPDGQRSSGSITYPSGTVPSSAAMALPAAPDLLTPTQHATGVAAPQTMSWSAVSAPVAYQAVIQWPNGSYLLATTASPGIDLSRLALAGVGLTPATTYGWTVGALPGRTLDDEVSAAASSGSTFTAMSVGQIFTTQ